MYGWLTLVLCVLAQGQSLDFEIPRLPISKANALYPDCATEVVFVLDVSSSVLRPDQKKMMRFVVQFMIAVESNTRDARFGVVIFGIDHRGVNATISRKSFNATEFGGEITSIPGPYGNQASPASTETTLSLAHLKYGCTECAQVNSSWSQLEYMYTLGYDGWLTPTWDGIDYGRAEFELHGSPNVPGRFIVLITDGVPNDGLCGTITAPGCSESIAKATEAVNRAKNGTLILTVGVKLDNNVTQDLMVTWASQPSELLAIPTTDFDKLKDLVGKFTSVVCPAGNKGVDCYAPGTPTVDISGYGFLNTVELGCGYHREGESYETKAIWRNATLISCPTGNLVGEWNLSFTQDGRGYYNARKLAFGDCQTNTQPNAQTNAQMRLSQPNFYLLVFALVSSFFPLIV